MTPIARDSLLLCKLPLSVRNYKGEYEYIKEVAAVNGFKSSEIDDENHV